MAKRVKAIAKMILKGGQANPAPPVGSVLGQHGLQLQDFCQKFNDATKDRTGQTVPVVVTIYDDRTFHFYTKLPPASELIKQEIGLSKGSDQPNKKKVGSITQAQLRAVAHKKMADLNANDAEAAMKVIAGTAKSMGLTVEEEHAAA